MSALQAAQWEFDNRLPPDDEWDCPYCSHPFTNNSLARKRHVMSCMENDDIDYPEEEL